MLTTRVEPVREAWQPSPKQQQAIVLLATGETIARTAQLVGITERQLYNWRAIPAFRDAVLDRLSAVLDQVVAGFVHGAPDALALVNRTHRGKGKVDRDRLANAQWALDRLRQFAELAGRRSADDQQSRLTVSQSLSVAGDGADISRLTDLLLGDRDAKRSLLVESLDVVASPVATDPAPDRGLRPV